MRVHMAEEYICGECGQRSEDDYCPICESKMVKLNDFDDSSYEMVDEGAEDDDEFGGGDSYGMDDFEEEELPDAA